mmetsp:Transcript_148811/g.414611  ORF Transcript_148811/g.414611 Transcript_148811/m.414611 type:complete len:336 (-) Transcript_148811:8-1015(-)
MPAQRGGAWSCHPARGPDLPTAAAASLRPPSRLLKLGLTLQLLAFANLPGGFDEVLLQNEVPLLADCEHPGLRADVPHIRAVEAVSELYDGIPVDVAVLGNGCRVDLQDVDACLLVRQGDLDLPVQAARPQEGRVQHVRPVGRHDDLHFAEGLEAVDLVQELHERALDLAVGGRALGEAPAADGVDLIHEDDARLVVPCVREHLADDARALADVLVHDRRGHDLDEVHGHVVRQGSREQRLAGARGPVEQHPLGGLDTYSHEELWVCQRQLDDLAHLPHLLRQASNVAVRNLAWILVEHAENRGVHLSRQGAHHRERGHVQGNARSGHELRLVEP